VRSAITLTLLIIAAITVQKISPHDQLLHGRSGPARHNSGPMGDEWSTWTRDAQIKYVRGYEEGYQRGDRIGCLDTAQFFIAKADQPNIAMPSEPAQNCLDTMLLWSESSESIASKISEYYATYPADYIVPVPLVMYSLSDQKRMTFLEIHHWYVEGELKRNP
jgi:hypothetical protein